MTEDLNKLGARIRGGTTVNDALQRLEQSIAAMDRERRAEALAAFVLREENKALERLFYFAAAIASVEMIGLLWLVAQ